MTVSSRRAGHIAMGLVLGVLSAACAANGPLQPRPAPFPGVATVSAPRPAPAATVLPEVVATALSLAGRPYVFGGADPAQGFDCSGLVWYSFLQHHIDVPRTTAALYQYGSPVDRLAIAPGDLVFFTTTAPGPSHVGLALDARTIVHAPSSGTTVRVERFDTPYWQSRLVGVRRVTDDQVQVGQ